MAIRVAMFWLVAMMLSMPVRAENHVVIAGFGNDAHPVYIFVPNDLTIHVGDTVTFNSNGGARGPHNVHADDDSFRCALGCDGEGGHGDPYFYWSVTRQFDHVGTIPFHCDEHVDLGERGVIRVVQDPDAPAAVPITPGFTGAWYDPAQSGHGILVEILDGNQFLTWWFTFTPNGQQAWFGNVGSIDPVTNTATVEALQTEGGRWIPNFDPSNVTNPVWGQLKFSFTDCNHGRVDFTSSTPGYGEGHMDLTRLTQPAGLACP
jgi:plastocyanin